MDVNAQVSPHCNVGSSTDECREYRFYQADIHSYCFEEPVTVSTWNVEGLTDIKMYQICKYMLSQRVGLVCLQETRQSNASYYKYYLDGWGFQVILSGGAGQEKEWAGVGFVVAPKLQTCIHGFSQISNRMISMKLRQPGGFCGIICAYAPHNARPTDEKLAFYEDLAHHYRRLAVNGPRFLYGDFNARIGQRRAGEEDIIGQFCFGREAVRKVPVPNRDLLVEFCWTHSLQICNTFFENPDEAKVTFYAPGTAPMDEITASGFAVLDLLLVETGWATSVLNVSSDRLEAFASHHFPVTASLRFNLAPRPRLRTKPKLDWSRLKLPLFRQRLRQQLHSTNHPGSYDTNGGWTNLCSDVLSACALVLPVRCKKPNKPWISKDTLDLIEKRQLARADADHVLERTLHKKVRASARKDRGTWLERLTANGDWDAMKHVRKPRPHKQGRLRNLRGELASFEQRSETLADHLEQVQWQVRPVTAAQQPEAPLREPFAVCMRPLAMAELRRAISKAKNATASKEDDVPIEVYKALALDASSALTTILEFCNQCWTGQGVPAEWTCSAVSLLYKKGDPAECDNYRPICVQTVCFKIYMSMIKQRLLDAGMEDALWPTQFGFRS